MSSCCHKDLPKTKQNCPNCGDVCLAVSLKTVVHQVQYPENQNLESGGYALCSNQECYVGYFSRTHMLRKEKLRFFKINEEAMLCYCFDISRVAYLSALGVGKADCIKDFIVIKTKASVCDCEVRNPSGRCCLADFKRMDNDNDS